jgi:hypothetical protein
LHSLSILILNSIQVLREYTVYSSNSNMYFCIYIAIYFVVSLTELLNLLISLTNFSDNTIDRSPFFMDGVDSSLKSIRLLGTDLTFVFYSIILFEIHGIIL